MHTSADDQMIRKGTQIDEKNDFFLLSINLSYPPIGLPINIVEQNRTDGIAAI